MMTNAPHTGHVAAFIDIGTNSIRMLVVRLNPNFSYTVISQEKEVVRLGEQEFTDSTLRRGAMDRSVLVCRKFVELAKTYGADEIIAVATSAAREAKNQGVLIDRLHNEAGLDVGIISGLEEARLIFLGVSSGIQLWDRNALFMDIGGGSTEISIGSQSNYTYLDSLKLGAIRLTTMFVEDGHDGPISDDTYEEMKKYVRGAVFHSVQLVKKGKVDIFIGSSGTIINLAEIANRAYEATCKANVLRRSHLKKVSAQMRSLPLSDRKRIPGINPERADIIIGGAAILETLMDELNVDELLVIDRGVRDGMLVDYLSKIEGYPHSMGMSVRETSVLQLGRSCNIDEKHAETVVKIALSLFDTSKKAGLHDLNAKDRELLKYAAYLHDIGDFISFTNHQAHSYYIIRNADLLGFDEKEITIMADLAKYHRKRPPKKKDPELKDLDARSQTAVVELSALLRLSESLDRSHASLVRSVAFVGSDKSSATLEIASDRDISLEEWGVDADAKAFERAFDKELKLQIRKDGNI